MLLVLCGLDDVSALWFAGTVSATGASCHVVTTEELSYALRFSHRISGEPARVRTEIRLAGGVSLSDVALTGVLNRAIQPPAAAWHAADADERNYATTELHACTLSWLHALPCPVRNRPTPECLTGPARHPMVTVVAAAAAGLPCPDVTFDSSGPLGAADTLLHAAARAAGAGARPIHLACLDGELYGPAALEIPRSVSGPVVSFARGIGGGAALLGVDFVAGPRGWWFAGVSPWPDLRVGGDRLATALLATLSSRSEAQAGVST